MQNINDDLIVDNYLESYLEYINQFPILSKEEINNLFKNHDYDTIFNHNLRLVPFIAKKFIKNSGSLSFMDLIQEGNIGLIEAIKKFDYTLNNAFSTYAAFWIKQKIGLLIATNSRTINLSYDMHFENIKYKKTLNKLTINLGRNPTNIELANELNISLNKLQTIINSDKTIYSLDDPLKYFDDIANYDDNEDKILNSIVARDIIKYAKLSKKDFEILQDYYYYEISPKNICIKYNCTRQNIESSIKNSLKKLQIAKEEISIPKITKLQEININELYYFFKTRSIRQTTNYFKKFSSILINNLLYYADLTLEEKKILDKLLGINSLVIYSIEDIANFYNYDKENLYNIIKSSFHKLALLIKLLYPEQTKTRKKTINHD